MLGNGGTSGGIVGDVTNNGTLAFNRSNAMTFAGVISGAGAVNQVGTARHSSGSNNYTGGTTIAAGTLSSAMAAPPARSWVTCSMTARSPSTAPMP